MRCGACNEVFDGNAALVEPAAAKAPMAPLPSSSTHAVSAELAVLDAAMAALDTRAAETLPPDEAAPIYTLDVETAEQVDDGRAAHHIDEAEAPSPVHAEPAPAVFDVPAYDPSVAEGSVTAAVEALDLDLDVDLDVEPDAPAGAPAPDAVDAAVEAGGYSADAEDLDPEPAAKSDADIAAELAALSQADADSEPSFDAIVELASELSAEPPAEVEDYTRDERREPTLGEPPSEHLVAAALDDHYHDDLDATREDDALAAAAADADEADTDNAAANADANDAADADVSADHADDKVHVSTVGLARASTEPVDHTAPADAIGADTEAAPDTDDAEEPGFVKRDRRRQKMGKAARIAMSVGSVALLVALLAQGIGTFRNQLAAELPQLKPALVSACALLGCKVELPTQIDDLSIEPGELQTIAENTYSFTTQLRNGGAITQAWPHIELVLNDNADKPVLRRVFAPLDYLATPADAAQGFAPRSEQSVKLYFEIAQLKASGYHIAVFYP